MKCSVCNELDGTNKFGSYFDADGADFQFAALIINAVLCRPCFARVARMFAVKATEAIAQGEDGIGDPMPLEYDTDYTLSFGKEEGE